MTDFATDYLVSAGRLMSTGTGEPRGDNEIIIDFAGGPYRFSGLESGLAQSLQRRYALLRTPCPSGTKAQIHINVFRAESHHFVDTRPRLGAYDIDIDYQESGVCVAACDFAGSMGWEPEFGGTLWIADGQIEVMQTAIENFFRVAAAYRLLDLGGVLLHSAGVTDDTRTWIFYGKSGAGKSTISRLGAKSGHRVLSDDMNALVPGDGGFHVHQFPFSGEMGQTAGARPGRDLCGIMNLIQAPDNRLATARPSEALGTLVISSPIVNNDPSRCERLFTNLSRLVEDTPVEYLMFSLDGRCWDLIGKSATG